MVIVGKSATKPGGGGLESVEQKRWAWLVVGGTILVAVSLEVVVAALTSRVLHSLGYPVVWVTVVGCAVGGAGFIVTLAVEKGHYFPLEGLAAGPAWGATISVLLGEVWLVGGHTLLLITGALLGGIGVVALGARQASVGRSTVLWASCASALALAVTASLWAIPDGLSLNFRWNNEGQLNQLVPVADKLLSNWDSSSSPCRTWSPPPIEKLLGKSAQLCGEPGNFGWSQHAGDWFLAFNSGGADTCERHLDGRWWEGTGNGVTCPIGFEGVGGG